MSPQLFVAVMGNLDLHARDSNTVVRTIARVTGHPKYNADTFENDVAVLKLNSLVPANHPTVQPIPLSKYEASAGEQCQSSGFGTTEFREDATAVRYLMAVNLTVNSRAMCNRLDSHAGGVQRGMFCAGPFEGGKDTVFIFLNYFSFLFKILNLLL